MNAIDLLKEDHRVVDDLFKRVEDTPPSKHPPIFKKIKNELDTHAHIEEKVFYPALKKQGNKELADITAEGIEEHSQIKKFLKEIGRTTVTDTREAKLKVLIEDTRHHVKEEEDEMFPLVEDQFTAEELETLGAKMEAEKKKFQKAKKIPARREAPKGTMATIVEKAKEFVAAAFTGGAEAPNGKPSKSTRPRAKAASSAKASSARKSNGGAKAASKAKSTAAKSGGKAKSSATAGSTRKGPTAKKKSAGSRSRTTSR